MCVVSYYIYVADNNKASVQPHPRGGDRASRRVPHQDVLPDRLHGGAAVQLDPVPRHPGAADRRQLQGCRVQVYLGVS